MNVVKHKVEANKEIYEYPLNTERRLTLFESKKQNPRTYHWK